MMDTLTTPTPPISDRSDKKSIDFNRLIALSVGTVAGLSLFMAAFVIHRSATSEHAYALPWLTIELSAICIAFGFSIHSYVVAICDSSTFAATWLKHIPTHPFAIDLAFLVANTGVFIAAVWTIFTPVYHLSLVLLIYLLFAWNNREVGNRCSYILTAEADHLAVRKRLVLMRAACQEENIPSVVVYAFAIIVLCGLSISGGASAPELKAFAGGAAAFHLVVSTLRYSKAISKDDALDLLAEIDPWPEKVTQRMIRTKLILVPNKWMFVLFVLMGIALCGFFVHEYRSPRIPAINAESKVTYQRVWERNITFRFRTESADAT